MKISLKLFLSFFGLTSLILIATLSLARWSFNQGFLNFISGLEQERLQFIATDIIEQYQSNNHTWKNLPPEAFLQIVQRHVNNRLPPTGQRLARLNHPPPNEREGRPPNPNRQGQNRSVNGPPTALFDAQGNWLAGAPQREVDSKTMSFMLTDDKEVIGYLYSWPNVSEPSVLANRFYSQQLWTSVLIGTICLTMASLLSWLLARRFLQPINTIIASVSRLSQGDYGAQPTSTNKDELGQLSRNVNALSQTLEKNRSAKNRWFADISHELRTPLTILSGEIEAIKAGIRPFNAQQLSSLEQETTLLTHLVDDLYELSLSDLGGLRYQFTELDLAECLERTVTGMQGNIKDLGLTIRTEIFTDAKINADAKRIEQLLINLITNAKTYTDSPGEIVLSLTSDKQNITLKIDDTAPSVSNGEFELLFEPLYRQELSRTRRSSGAGLGLTICKNIVDAHQGTILARPSQLGGVCIQITLPVKGAQR